MCAWYWLLRKALTLPCPSPAWCATTCCRQSAVAWKSSTGVPSPGSPPKTPACPRRSRSEQPGPAYSLVILSEVEGTPAPATISSVARVSHPATSFNVVVYFSWYDTPIPATSRSGDLCEIGSRRDPCSRDDLFRRSSVPPRNFL